MNPEKNHHFLAPFRARLGLTRRQMVTALSTRGSNVNQRAAGAGVSNRRRVVKRAMADPVDKIIFTFAKRIRGSSFRSWDAFCVHFAEKNKGFKRWKISERITEIRKNTKLRKKLEALIKIQLPKRKTPILPKPVHPGGMPKFSLKQLAMIRRNGFRTFNDSSLAQEYAARLALQKTGKATKATAEEMKQIVYSFQAANQDSVKTMGWFWGKVKSFAK